MQRRLDAYARLWTALEELASARGPPERTVNALFTAARGMRVRRATYQHDTGLSDGQAVRDLRLLARHGLIYARAETRGRHYVAGPDLAALQTEVDADLPPLVEPYERGSAARGG